jgi:hypothetical protein
MILEVSTSGGLRDTLIQVPAKFARRANQTLVIISLSLIFAVTTKKVWDFIYYPIENVITRINLAGFALPMDFSKVTGMRKFLVFDTNIRDRDRNVSVSRHFPIDTLKQQRLWANKQPLTDVQTKDLYFRFHIHSVNRINDFLQKTKVRQRTPFLDRTSKEQLEHLLEIQESYQDLQKEDTLIQSFAAKKLQNRGKGNPVGSYIEQKEVVDSSVSYFHPKSNFVTKKMLVS